jgi:hypothetical protein
LHKYVEYRLYWHHNIVLSWDALLIFLLVLTKIDLCPIDKVEEILLQLKKFFILFKIKKSSKARWKQLCIYLEIVIWLKRCGDCLPFDLCILDLDNWLSFISKAGGDYEKSCFFFRLPTSLHIFIFTFPLFK